MLKSYWCFGTEWPYFYAVKQPVSFWCIYLCVDQGAIPDIGFDFDFCFNCYIDCFTYSDLYLYSPLHLHSHVLTASNIPKQYFFVYLQKNKKWHILIHLHSILIICSWIYCIIYCFIIWLSYLLGQTSYWIKVIGIFSKRKNQPPYLSFWMFW